MESVIVEYQIKDNIVRVVKDVYIDKGYRKSIRYLFQFQNINNFSPTYLQESNQTFKEYKVVNNYKNVSFRTLGSALKHFNKAVSALNNGTNIK
jgi:hypothetical protein